MIPEITIDAALFRSKKQSSLLMPFGYILPFPLLSRWPRALRRSAIRKTPSSISKCLPSYNRTAQENRFATLHQREDGPFARIQFIQFDKIINSGFDTESDIFRNVFVHRRKFYGKRKRIAFFNAFARNHQGYTEQQTFRALQASLPLSLHPRGKP